MNQILQDRTDQILRNRIALGLTAGGVRRPCKSKKTKRTVKRKPAGSKKCPKGSRVQPKKKPVRKAKKVVRRKQKGGELIGDEIESLYGGDEYAGVLAGCEMCPHCMGSGLRPCKSLKTKRVVKRKVGVKRCPVGSHVRPKMKPGPKKQKGGSKTSKKKMKPGSKKQKGGSITAKKRVNPWVTFLKNYAKQNGMTYSEALSDPNATNEYHSR